MVSDSEYLSYLYETYHNRLYDFAYARTGNPDISQDLVADTMLTAWEKLDVVRTHPTPLGWLIRTLANKMRRELSKKRYQVEQQLLEELIPDRFIGTDGLSLPKLKELIPGDYPKGDSQLLIWRYDDGMEYKEIGEYIGIKTSAAQRRVSRALHRFRDYLNRHKNF